VGFLLKKGKKSKLYNYEPGSNQDRTFQNIAGLVAGQIGRGIDPYLGPLVPGASPMQERAFSLGSMFGQGADGMARRSALTDLASGRPAFSASPGEYERVYTEGIEAPTMRMWESRIIPTILQQYGAAGPSGAVIDALGESGGDLASQLAGQRAEYRFLGQQRMEEALESAAGRRLGATQQMLADELSGIDVASMLGETQRGIQSEQLASEYQRWEMSQPWANPWLGFIPSILSAQPFTPTQAPDAPSTWGRVVAKVFENPLSGMGGGK